MVTPSPCICHPPRASVTLPVHLSPSQCISALAYISFSLAYISLSPSPSFPLPPCILATCVCLPVCLSVCLSVCVCERERERERDPLTRASFLLYADIPGQCVANVLLMCCCMQTSLNSFERLTIHRLAEEVKLMYMMSICIY
jgi:hypothetical protein